jgi:Lon protease-like protein
MRASEAHDDAGVLPIFPLDYVLPGQLMALNVFEPRYRLMVCRGM